MFVKIISCFLKLFMFVQIISFFYLSLFHFLSFNFFHSCCKFLNHHIQTWYHISGLNIHIFNSITMFIPALCRTKSSGSIFKFITFWNYFYVLVFLQNQILLGTLFDKPHMYNKCLWNRLYAVFVCINQLAFSGNCQKFVNLNFEN